MTQRIEQTLWTWSTHKSAGSLIKSARKLRRASQAELAESLGVSSANISRIERGADLRVSTLIELARALQLEPILIPKEHITAVRGLLDALSSEVQTSDTQKPRFA